MKRFAPSAQRNRGPILEVLRTVLPTEGSVLEVACGSGEHAVHFAAAFPALTWWPSDLDEAARASTDAWAAEAGLANLRPAIAVDVGAPSATWPVPRELAAIVAINLVHIAPWSVAVGLFDGGAARLAPDGVLVTYGPYRFADGVIAPSNAAFDADLRRRDPAWGVRDHAALVELGAARGLTCAAPIALPANNHALVFRGRSRPL